MTAAASDTHNRRGVTGLLIGLMALAFGFRLLLLPLIQHPGIADPNHYYNLALRLLDGQGFTIDYIWQYAQPPLAIVHPENHWMPLTAAIAAGGMALGGRSVQAALMPFALIGALMVGLGYAAARQLGCRRSTSLLIGFMASLLPEFLLSSLRSDTTIVAALLTGVCILTFTAGLRSGRIWPLVISGLAAGLTYLTRNDGLLLLPMWAVTALVYALWGRDVVRLRWPLLIVPFVVFGLTIAPWLIRNVQEFGSATTPETRTMFFFTSHDDHWAYGRTFTLETMFASQSWGDILAKRLFELGAALYVSYSTLDAGLAAAVGGGLILLLARRDRQRLLLIAPVLILLLGIFIAYPLLIPYKSQAGSFKKAYLTLIPVLLPLAAYAFEQAITDRRLRLGALALLSAVVAANAFQFMRADMRLTNGYLSAMQSVAAVVQTLPDVTGDGERVIMAEDPWMIRFVGFRALMLPTESREVILEVAQRYGADYVLMPPNRPALDLLYRGAEQDARFVFAASVPGTIYELYSIEAEAGR